MRRKSVQFRVGLLVSCMLVVFAGLIVFIVGTAFDGPSARYHILFDENVKGMVVGSKVNFQGVPIGSVTDMQFRAGQTLVEITVDPRKADIQADTQARLDRLLVTGQVTVELEGWQENGASLAAGSKIAPKHDPMHQLKSTLPEVAEQIGQTLARVDRVLASTEAVLGPDNRARIAAILANAEAASRVLPEQASALLISIDDRIRELGVVAEKASAAIDALGGDDAEAAVAAFRAAAEGLVAVEQELAAAAGEATLLIAGLRNPLQSTLLTARESLREIRGLARKLQLAPTSLLFGVEEAEITIPSSPGASR